MLLVISTVCAAEECQPAHLEGPYGFLLYGETEISGDLHPVTNLGRVVLDREGGVSGTSSVMFNGLLLGSPVAGTYEVRRDCGMSWSLRDDSGGYQHFSGTVTPDSRRVQFRQTDPGGAQHGIMAVTSDSCSTRDIQKKYEFTLSGTFTPVSPGDASASVAARGTFYGDEKGNFKLARGQPPASADVTVAVEADCTITLAFVLPAEEGEAAKPIAMRGIVVDGGKEILAIQTDPGWMAWARFVAQ